MAGNRIIDMHAHIFPDGIAQKAADSIAGFYDMPARYNGTVHQLLQRYDHAGVGTGCVYSVAITPHYIASINIEHAYHSRIGGEYESFPGAVLTDTFQMSEENDPLDVEMVSGIGMQVGSLISQMTANVVLTPVDHYVKRVLKAPYYIRYMDDMLCIAPSKQQVWDIIGATDDFLRENFLLQLNNKTAVIPAGEGCEFIGKIVTPYKISIRKSTSLQIKRHLRFVQEKYATGEVPLEYALAVIQSYLGLLQHTDDKALREKICEDYVLVRRSAPE